MSLEDTQSVRVKSNTLTIDNVFFNKILIERQFRTSINFDVFTMLVNG